MSQNHSKQQQKQQPVRTAEVIQKEVPQTKPKPGFNQTTVEHELAQSRNKCQALNNRIESLNREMDAVRQELDIANKLKTQLDAAKALTMEIDRLKEQQNGNSS